MTGFNPGFADEDEAYLIGILQDNRGCFNVKCHKDASDATLRCSKCHLAKYCGKECQRSDWTDKACPHKTLCKVYRSNVAPSKQPTADGQKGPVAIALRSVGLIDEDLLGKALTDRTDSFLDEAKRCCSDTPVVSLQASVVFNLDKIRLQCAANFFDDATIKVVSVNHVVFEVVDDGDEAARRALHPSYGGPGKISEECRRRVLETLLSFFGKVNDRGMQINSLTYGRGLMWMSDEDFREGDMYQKAEEVNQGRKIMWLPDVQYAMQDSMVEAAKEAFGEDSPVMGMLPGMFGK